MSLKTVLLLLLLSLLPSACSESVAHAGIARPVLCADTTDQRAAGVRSLQTAWRERPRETTDDNRRAELRFLKVLGGYLNRIRDTQEFTTACNVWNECVRDHTQQYGKID